MVAENQIAQKTVVAPLPLELRLKTSKPEEVPALLAEIATVDDEVMRAVHLVTFAGKLNVNKKILTTRIEKIRATLSSGDTTTKMSALFPGLVDIGIDDTGNPRFIICSNDNILIDSPCMEIVKSYRVGDTDLIPPPLDKIEFTLPRAGEVQRWFDLGRDYKLFEDIWNFMGRFSFLENEQRIILVCYVYLTYLQDHPDIFYLAVIIMEAAPVRGKTRTAKALASVCYRGMIFQQIREPVLIRVTTTYAATQVLDVKSLWKQAVKRGVEDILLARFEKGARVPRVLNPDKGQFLDMTYFSAYGSTIVTTNEGVHQVFGSRCLPIQMQNVPGHYEDLRPEMALEYKERLTAWRARALYQSLPQVNPVEGIVGRLADISKPLFQICMMECPAALDLLTKAIRDIAAGQVADKRYSPEFAILTALRDLAPAGQTSWKTPMVNLMEELNTDKAENQKMFPAVVGKKVRELGMKAKIIQGYSTINMNREQLDSLMTQYGVDPVPENRPVVTGNSKADSVVVDILNSIK